MTTEQSSTLTRLRPLGAGEITPRDLGRYLNTPGVIGLLGQLQRDRADLIMGELGPWDIGASSQYELLESYLAASFWGMLVEFVAAYSLGEPGTDGEGLLELGLQCGLEIEGHMQASGAASLHYDYRRPYPGLVPLPWVGGRPSRARLAALLVMAERLSERTVSLLEDVRKADRTDAQQFELLHVTRLVPNGHTELDIARTIYGTGDFRTDAMGEIEDHARTAVQALFDAGQFLSAPLLIADYCQPAPSPAVPMRVPGPEDHDFELFCLTAPAVGEAIHRGCSARDFGIGADRAFRSVFELWGNDPNPTATSGIQAEINAALSGPRPAVVISQAGYWYAAPWAPIYRATRPVIIGCTDIQAGQTFTYDVAVGEGRAFTRTVVLGPFRPTDDIDYRDGVITDD